MSCDPRWGDRLVDLQRRVRDVLRKTMAAQDLDAQSRQVRDDDGDTIFGIDVDAEDVLLACCEEWSRNTSFVVVAEGLEPEGRRFGAGDPTTRVIVDPIDGTRGLMYDKRSAWSLAAVAPELGDDTMLSTVEIAVMTELPTTRQNIAETLVATRGQGTSRIREDLASGTRSELPLQPSQETHIRHGFATVANFFQGGKELTSRIEEEIFARSLGGWTEGKAEVYTDQYISSGGQLAELALGRDRFVLDMRPLVHRSLGHADTLCSRPYDLCTALVATEAGCVVTSPLGGPLDAPLDTTTNVGFAGYANRTLAEHLIPIVTAVLTEHGLSS